MSQLGTNMPTPRTRAQRVGAPVFEMLDVREILIRGREVEAAAVTRIETGA